MAKMHVKKGDTVQVITGKDTGVTGKVIAAYPETEQRVLVEGVNRIKKHTKVGQNDARRQDRRHRHAGGADPRQQRDAGGRARRQEGRHPRRLSASTTTAPRRASRKRTGEDI